MEYLQKIDQYHKRILKDHKIVLLIFISGLFISPFIFWPFSKIAFEIPKVNFINRWIELLSIFAILLIPKTLIKERFDKKILYFTGLFILISLLSSITGSNFSKSLVGNYYRNDGLLTLFHLVIFMLLTAILLNKVWIEKSIGAITLSAIALSFTSILSASALYLFNLKTLYLPDWQGAIGMNFGNPNFLAGFLLVTLPFNYYFSIKNKNLPGKVFFAAQIIAIFLTRAWSGVLGIIIFMLGIFIIKKNKKMIYLLITLILVLGGYLIFYNNLLVKPSAGTFIGESRQRIFMKGLIAFTKKPILGYGVSNFDYAFQNAQWPIKINNDVYVDKAHSILLEVLTTTGIVGLTVYLLLIGNVFNNIKNSQSPIAKYLLLSFLLFIFHSQTNIISVSEELVFWFLVGVSIRRN